MRDLRLTARYSEDDSPKAVGKVSTGSRCQFIRKSDIHVGSRDHIPGPHTRPVQVTKPDSQIATGIVRSDLKGKLEKISCYCPMLGMAMTSWARVGCDTMYWSQTRVIAVIGEGSTVIHIAVSLTPGDTEDAEITLLYPASEDHVSGPDQSEPSDLTTSNSICIRTHIHYINVVRAPCCRLECSLDEDLVPEKLALK